MRTLAPTRAPAEVTSAVWRLVRDGQISESTALAADQRAQEFLAAARGRRPAARPHAARLEGFVVS